MVDFSGGGVHFTGHSHRYDYELILVLEGVIGLQLEKRRHYHLGKGDFVLLAPGIFHWMWSEAPPGRYYNYIFQGDLPLLEELAGAGPFSLTGLSSHLQDLMGSLSRRERGYGVLRDPYYFLWTAGLLERICRHGLHREPLTIRGKGGFEDRLRRIIADRIEDDPGARPTAEELAGLVGLERSYLARRVRQYTGRTLMELYFRELFEQAALFLEGGASVKECAYRFGFANPYHFSRKFKEMRGVSPSGWPSGKGIKKGPP